MNSNLSYFLNEFDNIKKISNELQGFKFNHISSADLSEIYQKAITLSAEALDQKHQLPDKKIQSVSIMAFALIKMQHDISAKESLDTLKYELQSLEKYELKSNLIGLTGALYKGAFHIAHQIKLKNYQAEYQILLNSNPPSLPQIQELEKDIQTTQKVYTELMSQNNQAAISLVNNYINYIEDKISSDTFYQVVQNHLPNPDSELIEASLARARRIISNAIKNLKALEQAKRQADHVMNLLIAEEEAHKTSTLKKRRKVSKTKTNFPQPVKYASTAIKTIDTPKHAVNEGTFIRFALNLQKKGKSLKEHHHVKRWEGKLNDKNKLTKDFEERIKNFPDLTDRGEKRYIKMSSDQLLEQYQKHCLPLTELLLKPLYRKIYGVEANQGCIFISELESIKGNEMGVLELGFDKNKLFHRNFRAIKFDQYTSDDYSQLLNTCIPRTQTKEIDMTGWKAVNSLKPIIEISKEGVLIFKYQSHRLKVHPYDNDLLEKQRS